MPDAGIVAAYTQKEAIELFKTSRGQAMLPSGIPSLDSATGGGLPVRQLTIILGYTKVGKSEVVRQFRRSAIANGHPVIHLDVELGVARIMEREICQLGNINALHLRQEQLTREELISYNCALAQLEAERLVWTTCPGNKLTQEQLTNLLETQLSWCGETPALIILDSLQRFALGSSAGGSFREKTANFLSWAEQFSHSHNAAVLMTSERNRPPPGVEQKIEDAVSSGAESRSIEYYSDLLIALQPTGSLEEVTPESEHTRVVRAAILTSRLGVCGWLKHDLCFHYPTWGFSLRAHDNAHVSKSDIEGASEKLTVGLKYSAKDLADLWSCGHLKAKGIIEVLVGQGRINKFGRQYSLPPAAVGSDKN